MNKKKEKKVIKDKLDKILDKHNLNQSELEAILKQSKIPKIQKNNVYEHDYNSKHIRIGVMSDLHIGHSKFDEKLFLQAVNRFNQHDIEAVYCPGDIIEGMSGREGHIYELKTIGVTNQLDYATNLLNEINKPFYFILGNHDLWALKKGNQGVHVGKELERRLSNTKYLGDLKATVKLTDNVTMELSHEGSSAYALSYSMQKRINALEGGTKPNIKLNGHIHKMLYMVYRNIHALECGTMERQTEFMAMKGSPAHVGYIVADIYLGTKGVESFQPTFYTEY